PLDLWNCEAIEIERQSRCAGTLAGAQLGRAGARILRYLCGGRFLMALEHRYETRLARRLAAGHVTRSCGQLAAPLGEEALDDAVFERMKSDDGEAAFGLEHVLGG